MQRLALPFVVLILMGAAGCGDDGSMITPDGGDAMVVDTAPPDTGAADTGVDAPPTCTDGMHNGDETDTDCGGPDCGPCSNGDGCAVAGDCMSALCDSDNGRCRFARSCLELRQTGQTEDGTYAIDPDGVAEAFEAFNADCDMTTDGGGWTGVTPAIAREILNGSLTAVETGAAATFDDRDRPCSRSDGAHTYHYTFDFPAGFSEFYLEDFAARANAASGGASELSADFVQTDWATAHDDVRGDISFGSPFDAGPVTSFAAEASAATECEQCEIPWPGGATVYAVGEAETSFRIGWGEAGDAGEGWCPWYAGVIRLR